MMVAMGHGLCVCFCVCGETTKNKEESKIVNKPYVRMLTAWKALSHANTKGKGINSEGWVGNQVFRLAEEEKKK
jgi:hypothetical protein